MNNTFKSAVIAIVAISQIDNQKQGDKQRIKK